MCEYKNKAKNEKLIVCQWQSPNGFFDVWKDILVHFIVTQKVSLVYYMHGIQCSFPYYIFIVRHALIRLLKMGYASISSVLWYKVSKLEMDCRPLQYSLTMISQIEVQTGEVWLRQDAPVPSLLGARHQLNKT